MTRKIITRVKGGIGNQLFCYAAARRLAQVNGAELVIDDVTGFVRDRTYQRRYALDHFSIPCRKATPWERKEPLERARRALSKWGARLRSYEQRAYIEQLDSAFDPRLLDLRPQGSVYLDGYWQDERYFSDVADTVRSDLAFRLSPPLETRELGRRIAACDSVALHVRWFDHPAAESPQHNLGAAYYQGAIDVIEQRVHAPHYFLFSDDPAAARDRVQLPRDRVTYVDQDPGDEGAILDLWLMSRCKHFVMANSTFSWWGAWLGGPTPGVVLMPPDVPPLVRALIWDGDNGWHPSPSPSRHLGEVTGSASIGALLVPGHPGQPR